MSDQVTVEVKASVLADSHGDVKAVETEDIQLYLQRGYRFAGLLIFKDGQSHALPEPDSLPAIEKAAPLFAEIVRERVRDVPLATREAWVNAWRASQSQMS